MIMPSLLCTFVINSPGTYKLNNDIIYTPTAHNDAAILISSNDVLLDMQGYHISQSTITYTGLDAIVVSPNVSAITIVNGTIQNITGRGIVVNQGCSRIVIDHLFTSSCDRRGIEIAGEAANPVSIFDIKNINISGCCRGPYGDYPLYIRHASNVRITDCRISQNGISSHDISGIRIENCTTSRFEDIRVNTSVGGTVIKGFDLSNVGDSFFLTCVSRNNNPSNTNGSAVGFDFQTTCTDNFLVNCFAFASTATTTNTTCAGFKLGAGCDNNVITNCKATQNTAHGACYGFSSVSNSGNSFIDCLAINNKSLNGIARGYCINGCTNNIHIRCIAHGNNSTNSIGIGMDYDGCTECFNQESFLTKNQGSSNANSFGMRLQNDSNSGFVKNIAMRNGTTAGNQLNGLGITQKNDQALNAINGVGQPWTNIGFN